MDKCVGSWVTDIFGNGKQLQLSESSCDAGGQTGKLCLVMAPFKLLAS